MEILIFCELGTNDARAVVIFERAMSMRGWERVEHETCQWRCCDCYPSIAEARQSVRSAAVSAGVNVERLFSVNGDDECAR